MGAAYIIPFLQGPSVGYLPGQSDPRSIRVSKKHREVITANNCGAYFIRSSLADFSVATAVRCRTSRITGIGGFCVGPTGDTLLVVSEMQGRVHEIKAATGVRLRVLGEGLVRFPVVVACDATTVAIGSHADGHVCLLSYRDGSVLYALGVAPSWAHRLQFPECLTLLRDDAGIAIPDKAHSCVCLFTRAGQLRNCVRDERFARVTRVLEHPVDGGLLVMTNSRGLVVGWSDGSITDTPSVLCDIDGITEGETSEEFLVTRTGGVVQRVRCPVLRAYWLLGAVTLSVARGSVKRQKVVA